MVVASRCPYCGSGSITLLYDVPVLVQLGVSGITARKVRVIDEAIQYEGKALCDDETCGRQFHLSIEPDTGVWPAWDIGPG